MSDADDAVGFGKPPKETRWRKGQSGNPKGRPKTKSDYMNDAAAILSESVTATTPDGRSVIFEGYEAAYLALCRKGLKGHAPSLIDAIKIMLDVGPALQAEQANKQALTDKIRRLAAKYRLDLPDFLLD